MNLTISILAVWFEPSPFGWVKISGLLMTLRLFEDVSMKRISWLARALLLLTALTLFGQGPVFAQGDSGAVFYPGEPPLTQGMVDQLTSLFEWILDARFTPHQRV